MPNFSNSEILNTFSPFITELEKEINMSIEIVIGKNYSDTINMFRNKEIDIGMLGSLPLITAQKEFGVKVFVRNREAAKNDDPPKDAYHSIIITRKDSGIQNLTDLKGKTFAFTDPKSSSGYLFPLHAMISQGVLLTDLSKVFYVKKHANSLLAVYDKRTAKTF